MRPRKEDSPQVLLLRQAVEGIADISVRLKSLESRSAASARIANLRSLADLTEAPTQQFDTWLAAARAAFYGEPFPSSAAPSKHVFPRRRRETADTEEAQKTASKDK
jgi:hypothetical protein